MSNIDSLARLPAVAAFARVYLPGARSEEQTKRLYWAPETTDDDLETEAQTKLYMDEGDPIRFRFLGDEYEYGSAPSAKQKTACAYKVYVRRSLATPPLAKWSVRTGVDRGRRVRLDRMVVIVSPSSPHCTHSTHATIP